LIQNPLATVPGKYPDPLSPDATTEEFNRHDALNAALTGASRSPGVWSTVTTWWRTDQTRWIHKEFLTTDLLCLLLSACAAVYAHVLVAHYVLKAAVDAGDIKQHFALLLMMSVLVTLFCQNYGLYRAHRTRRFIDEAQVVAKSLLLSLVLLLGFALLAGLTPIIWDIMLFAVTLQFGSMLAWRHHEFTRTERRMSDGVGTRNVLIVGAGTLGRQVARTLERERHLGYVVKGFLDDVPQSDDTNVIGTVEQLAQAARAQFVDEIIIALPWDSEMAAKAAIEARRQRLNVKLVPNFYGGMGWRAPLEYMGEVPAFSLHREPIPAVALLLKRVIDVMVSGVGLVVLSPVLALLAIAVKLDSPGPVFYRSTRVGKKGRRFLFYKFRTMVANADALKEQLRAKNERKGPFFKMANDPRMTRVGRYLRRYSVDEIPQLWNVLKGDMSLVGPRPHPLDDYQQYSLDHLRRLDVMPGITGLWQVQARNESSWEANMTLDLEYIEHWTPWLDIKLLFKTIPIVVKGLGQ
jgi:exopolysaccharide biosynthesis polyprenyl glycosylphosphotransferase